MVLLRIGAETVIWQSKWDTLCQRSKAADQAFVATSGRPRRLRDGEGFGNEVKVSSWLCTETLPRDSHIFNADALGLASSWGRGCTRHAAPSMSRPPVR